MTWLIVGGTSCVLFLLIWYLTYKAGIKSGNKNGRDETLLEMHELANRKAEDHAKRLEEKIRALDRVRKRLRLVSKTGSSASKLSKTTKT